MNTKETKEILINQGKNTINSMENLKGRATKKDKERSDLFQKFRANEHSFRVYTYMDPIIGQTEEVQSFLAKVELFGGNFTGVDTELDTEVDKKEVQHTYNEALVAYNKMVNTLGFKNEAL